MPCREYHKRCARQSTGTFAATAPIPPAIEDVARDEQQHILRLQISLHDEPIQSEDDRQEEQEFGGVEEHGIN